MNEWNQKSLGTFLEFRTGKLDSNQAISNGRYPFFTCSPETLKIDQYAFDDEAVLLAGNNANGIFPVKYYNGKFNAYQRTYVITPKDKKDLDVRWLYFLILNLVRTLQNLSIGSATRFLTKRILEDFVVAIPPFNQQKSISKILGALDDKIENNRRINEMLERMAQAIFKSWFIDFDPVKAKIAALEASGSTEDAIIAAMQAISGMSADDLDTLHTQNEAAYADLKSAAEAFPSSLSDTALGSIPEGWKSSEIGNEIDAVGGGTPSTKEAEFWDNGTVHWTTPKDMSDLHDKVLIDTERKITMAGLKKISSGLLPVDTVLMSSRAPVGYLAIAKIPLAINQGYIAMKCNKLLTPEFIIQWCFHNMEEIKQRASGTTFAEISKKSFYPIPVIVPGNEVLRAYTKNVRDLYSKIEANVRENKSLILIRDNLLPKLLSGEISVKDHESAQG